MCTNLRIEVNEELTFQKYCGFLKSVLSYIKKLFPSEASGERAVMVATSFICMTINTDTVAKAVIRQPKLQ